MEETKPTTIKVSKQVRDRLEEYKKKECHTSMDSAIRTLLLTIVGIKSQPQPIDTERCIFASYERCFIPNIIFGEVRYRPKGRLPLCAVHYVILSGLNRILSATGSPIKIRVVGRKIEPDKEIQKILGQIISSMVKKYESLPE